MREATVSIANDDSDENPYTFSIQGTGADAPLVLFGANTFPAPNATLASGITHLTLEFNMDVKGAANAQSANHITNYLLFSDGGDGFQTVDCAGGVNPADVNIPIQNAYYDDQDEVGPFIVTLTINNDKPLAAGSYRFLACGTTSIENHAGVKLNDGADTALDFSVRRSSSTNSGSSENTGSSTINLPATGFAPGIVHSLPSQPASSLYSETDMTLSIPKLDINMPIVGVPKVLSGWDVTWLGDKAGYLAGTAFPTWIGNTVLTGHVWDEFNQPGPFAELKTLRYGDPIQIHIGDRVYTYQVRESSIISPLNVDAALAHEDFDWVTLLTCEDYNASGRTYSYRRMVRAVLVDVK